MTQAKDADTTLVLSLYGSVMLAAQAMEQTLATLSILLDARKPQPPTTSRAQFQRRLRKTINKATHRFQRASASELRNLLPDDIDAGLLRDLEIMIKWRDLLAHRYLLKQIVDEPDRQFAASTAAELLQVHKQFVDITKRITAKSDVTLASLPTEKGPSGIREAFESLARPLMFGEPFEPPTGEP